MTIEVSLVPKFTELNELASKKNCGKILFATDDWFAEAENLLKDDEPVFKKDLYTDCGKWMDGWETRRRRRPGHDWCVVKLGVPGLIKGVELDTAFFTGNFAPRFSIQAAILDEKDEELFPKRTQNMLGTACSEKVLEQLSSLSNKWTELIPMTPLKAGYEHSRRNYFQIVNDQIWTHLRLNIYPDGGIARFRVYGEAKPTLDEIHDQTVDLVSMKAGGICIGYSNAHYGHPRNLIRPGNGLDMGDGWETARRLDRPAIIEVNSSGILRVPGNEWAIFRLSSSGRISHLEIDTKHFKGNYPDSVKVEGALVKSGQEKKLLEEFKWQTILPTSKLAPHRLHVYEELVNHGPFSHVKITIAPDGGVSRLRVFGKITKLQKDNL